MKNRDGRVHVSSGAIGHGWGCGETRNCEGKGEGGHGDRATADRIESLHDEEIGPADACGCVPIGGLLKVARRKRMRPVTLDLRNSGDTAGPRTEVVGYGAFLLA